MRRLLDLVVNDLPQPIEPTAVVLAHGYLGALPKPYWIGCAGLVRHLRARGVEVRIARAEMTGRVADRARALAMEVDRAGARRVILIGHSMGGLDARYVARWLDPAKRVSDVITLGTPHRGTYAADLALRLGQRLPVLLRLVDQGGLAELTRAAGRRRAEEIPDRPDVRYRSICGRTAPAGAPLPLRPLAERLQRRVGDNDGLVPVASARWGETVVIDDADHWSLIGLELLAGPDLPSRLLARRDRRPVAVLRRLVAETLRLPRQSMALRT